MASPAAVPYAVPYALNEGASPTGGVVEYGGATNAMVMTAAYALLSMRRFRRMDVP